MLSRKPVFASLAVVILAALACGLPAAAPTPLPLPAQVTAPTVVPIPTTPPVFSGPVVTTSEEQALIELYQRVNPSVVAILVEDGLGGGLGTGFVYDTEGHIVTNHHVVEGATSIEVDFPSGFKTRARVLGTDPDSDLAALQLDSLPEQLAPLPLGDSDQVRVGQRVAAIGNPFGYRGTMTLGIVSGLGRTLESTRRTESGTFSAPDIIQTDAAINRGNSGGPLLNLQGEVIGVNKALESETGENSGVGFAIASNTIRQVVPYLIRDGKFVYPYLGISSLDVISLHVQEVLGLPQANGVYVTSVTPNGPAALGGVKADSASLASEDLRGDGDLIVAVDGRAVTVLGDLLSYLINHKRPGQEVMLTILRAGQTVEVKVALGERP
jgi:2-alkenal reductase